MSQSSLFHRIGRSSSLLGASLRACSSEFCSTSASPLLSSALSPLTPRTSRGFANANDFELLNPDSVASSPHVLIESCGKGYFNCVGGIMQNPRQRVRGPVLIYGPGCFNFSPPGYRGKDAFVQIDPSTTDSTKKKLFRYRIPPLSLLTPDVLSILRLMKPSPDLLVIGTGDDYQPLPEDVTAYLRAEGLLLEIQDTEHAVGTWNVLTQEERKVVGLFFPLDKKVGQDEEEEGLDENAVLSEAQTSP